MRWTIQCHSNPQLSNYIAVMSPLPSSWGTSWSLRLRIFCWFHSRSGTNPADQCWWFLIWHSSLRLWIALGRSGKIWWNFELALSSGFAMYITRRFLIRLFLSAWGLTDIWALPLSEDFLCENCPDVGLGISALDAGWVWGAKIPISWEIS
jgi:hypothetical protein